MVLSFYIYICICFFSKIDREEYCLITFYNLKFGVLEASRLSFLPDSWQFFCQVQLAVFRRVFLGFMLLYYIFRDLSLSHFIPSIVTTGIFNRNNVIWDFFLF